MYAFLVQASYIIVLSLLNTSFNKPLESFEILILIIKPLALGFEVLSLASNLYTNLRNRYKFLVRISIGPVQLQILNDC